MTPPDENEVSIVHNCFIETVSELAKNGKTPDERVLAETLLGLYIEVAARPETIRYINNWASDVLERNEQA